MKRLKRYAQTDPVLPSAPSGHRTYFRRPPFDRMLRIHEFIAEGRRPSCRHMAGQLEVSLKTVKRDIEFLRGYRHLPIEYDRQRHGYFYSHPVDDFPGAFGITEAELVALLAARKATAQYNGTPFHEPLRRAFDKLTRHVDPRLRCCLDNLQDALCFRPFAPEDTAPTVFEMVTRALRHRQGLSFQYRKLGEKCLQARNVQPLHLICSDNRWYLIAHDADRDDTRTFALNRLRRPVLTQKIFEKPAGFDLKVYLRNSFQVMQGHGDYEVVIEFDAWATDLIRGRQWHASQQVNELTGGGSQMRLRLSGLEEIERWILSWGTHATVIRPRELATRLGHIATTLAQRYPEGP